MHFVRLLNPLYHKVKTCFCQWYKYFRILSVDIPYPSQNPASFSGLVEFFFLLLLPLRCLAYFRNLGNTVSLLLALFPALFLLRFLKVPELIVQATETKVKAESLAAERAKDLQSFRKKTTDYVTKSKFFRSIRKKHIGNFAGYVMNRKHSGK